MEQHKKALLYHPRIIILAIALLIALFAISPHPFQEGAVVASVEMNSTAFDAGMRVDPSAKPMEKEVVLYLDNEKISTSEDFYAYIHELPSNITVRVETSKDIYRLTTGVAGDIGLNVKDAPKTNIRKGLDLEGGTQVFLEPEEQVDESILDEAVKSLKLRLNTYGLSDVAVRKITNPSQFIIVEVAGATQAEVRDLLSSQGKFEAMIVNTTVFRGTDIKFVGRDARNARIEKCGPGGNGFVCSYSFNFIISTEAAASFGAATDDLEVIDTSLSETIDFFLDDILITNLSISADLKGREVTNPSITGSEFGLTSEEAYRNAQTEMNKLQTIIETGSLPIKLTMARSSTISPVLGHQFTWNAILVGVLAILAVSLVCFAFFRKFKVIIPMLFTMISEVVLLLGLSALINWQLDLAAIAGIIIAAGTGVDDQIIITHEIIGGEFSSYNWKQKIKRAFFIIMAAYFTTVVAMLPLLWAGAGLLKGFAFITIAGISFGVFITRPAYAKIMEFLMK